MSVRSSASMAPWTRLSAARRCVRHSSLTRETSGPMAWLACSAAATGVESTSESAARRIAGMPSAPAITRPRSSTLCAKNCGKPSGSARGCGRVQIALLSEDLHGSNGGKRAAALAPPPGCPSQLTACANVCRAPGFSWHGAIGKNQYGTPWASGSHGVASDVERRADLQPAEECLERPEGRAAPERHRHGVEPCGGRRGGVKAPLGIERKQRRRRQRRGARVPRERHVERAELGEGGEREGVVERAHALRLARVVRRRRERAHAQREARRRRLLVANPRQQRARDAAKGAVDVSRDVEALNRSDAQV
eukprot:6185655-Pleurochrysis_carterae.AAC.1